MTEIGRSGATVQGERTPLVRTEELSKVFVTRKTVVRRVLGRRPDILRAVDGVGLSIYAGETLGVVGESGCGKTTLGRLILGLYKPTAGAVFFNGTDISRCDAKATRELRKKMQIVFQDPYSSLDPRMTVKQALCEALLVHNVCAKEEATDKAAQLLTMVGLTNDALDRLPHEFSGGQRQRIGIARAVAVEPQFIVADEPVSALDVSVQAQVINLLMELQEKLHVTMMIIAHDLRLVRHVSNRVAVMYLGKVVEVAPCEKLFDKPVHPYTQALLAAAPRIDPSQRPGHAAIKGEPPSPLNLPSGCRFHTRCEKVVPRCREEEPPLALVDAGHFVACRTD